MRKIKLAAAAFALAMIPVAAHADWTPTRWGMNVAQVTAAFPGTTSVTRDAQDDLLGLQLLAQAPHHDGDVALTAEFYFEPGGAALRLVSLRVVNAGQCDGYRATLTGRLGSGKVYSQTTPDNDKIQERSTVWSDPVSHDQLIFYEMLVADGVPVICKFVTRPQP